MRTPPKNRLNLAGRSFGRLTVTHEGERSNQQRRWYCRCTCGNVKLIYQNDLLRQKTQSCGCLHNEQAKELFTTHGKTDSPEYVSWVGMKTRCYNPNYREYHLYGGRGVQVCRRWRDSFENFLRDMGPKPTPQHSIDRKDNDKNYEPSNCHWATPLEQTHNRRPRKKPAK